MKTIYLAGPINGCTDAECKDWREKVKREWRGRAIDPMVRDYRGREDEAFVEIVEGDIADIEASDIILVNYDRPSVGTAMEIRHAWQIGKPVLVVAKEGERISPWLRFHAYENRIFHSFGDALDCAFEISRA